MRTTGLVHSDAHPEGVYCGEIFEMQTWSYLQGARLIVSYLNKSISPSLYLFPKVFWLLFCSFLSQNFFACLVYLFHTTQLTGQHSG